MKKSILLTLIFLSIFTLASCTKEKKEDINTLKEFNTGDIVTFNGIIYEYIDVYKDIFDKDVLEYVFEEEENYKAFYSTYYLDMSDYKNQPRLRDDKNVNDLEWKFTEYHSPRYSPTQPYAFYIPTYFHSSDELYFNMVRGSFIVKGYTEELPENVVIPEKIHGKYILQIGYRAFENAPMKTLKISESCYVHPFAINNCNNLEEITFFSKNESPILSMGICNCDNLKRITGACPAMDCSLYNLPQLHTIDDLKFFFNNKSSYNMGGIRKSFFYNCPKLKNITGKTIEQAFNVVYFTLTDKIIFPIYLLRDNYAAIVPDFIFSVVRGNEVYMLRYNPETLEAYVPFLNDGLEKEGTILFKHDIQGPEAVMEDETGIYIDAIYSNSKYNAKLLFKRK